MSAGSWPLALFLPSGILFVVGSAVYVVYGRAELQDYSDCSPLWCVLSTTWKLYSQSALPLQSVGMCCWELLTCC